MIKETASIEIAVKGMNQVNRLTQKLELSSKSIDKVNKLLAGKKGRGSIFADYLDGVKLSVRSTNSLNKNLALAQTNFNKVALGTKSATIAARDFVRANRAVADGLRERNKLIEEAERVVASERFRRGDLSGDPNAYSRPIGPRPSGTKSSGRGNPRFNRGNFGNIASSAIIGGSFPLLFGQTGAAAVGGGLGGLAGGAIGGQFGFALSILGTAIGAAIDKNDKFNQSLAVLNVRFGKVSTSSQLTAKDIDAVAKRLRITKEEAFAVLGAFSQFGSGSIAKSLTEIFGSDAGGFEGIASASRQAELANQIFEARKKIGIERAIELQQQNLSNKASVVELAFAEARAQAENDIAVAQAKQIKFSDRAKTFAEEYLLGTGGMDASRYGEGRAKELQEEFEKNRNTRMENFIKSLEKYRELLDLTNEAQGKFGQSGVLAVSAINDKVKDLTDEMLRLQDPIFQLISASEVIATSFSTSFKDIIRGTKTVQQAFADMFQRIADHFLDMAAQMMAASIQKGILGLFSNFLGGVTQGSFMPSNPAGMRSVGVGATANDLTRHFASGGYVSGPTMGLIGEAGESEYVIPASKMSGAMSRYSAGARGGAVIPGGSGDSGTVAGGTGNAIVEYTGPVLNFNGDEYVPKTAVPEIINTAAKQGASAGRSQAFSALKNSRSQRATLGL